MSSLIVQATAAAHWQILIAQAQTSCTTRLNAELEHYLVSLLMRFTAKPEMASSVLGLEFLSSYQQPDRQARQQQLKEVGDKCLLFAGLFPEQAHKRRVKLSYYVKLGQTAYSSLDACLDDSESLYITLAQEFPKMMDVLHATRGSSHYTHDLLDSLELWHETGSPAAWQRISKATHALPVIVPQPKTH